METLLQDIRYGLRNMLGNPGVTAAAMIVLTLGIGANTAIFTIVNAVLLRPLPYPNGERLVMLWETNPRFRTALDAVPVTPGNFMDWREQNQSFEHVSAFGAGHLNLTGAGEPERIACASVSPNFFALMGIEPRLGRAFRADEEKPGADKVVVISHALWQRRFGGEPGVVGKILTLNESSYTVVGVAPEGFQFPQASEMPIFVGAATQTDLWKPLTLTDEFIGKKRANHQLCVLAKLKPSVSLEQAQTEMTPLAERLAATYPESNQGIGVKVVPLTEQIVGNVRRVLMILMGAVALVLLIACANVANLLLGRAAARQKEIAIRAALGAGRLRIVRLLFTEALLLSLAASVAGILVSLWGVKMLSAIAPTDFPRLAEVNLDVNVLGFSISLALISSALFGLAPALQASKINLTDALKEGAGLTGGVRRNRVRSLLVIAEIALSLILLVGAGLMIKSLARLLNVDPGFKTENTLTMRIALPGSRYPGANQQVAFFQEVSRRAEEIPGVQSFGLTSTAPLSGGVYAGGFSIEGRTIPSESGDLVADRRMISPRYFNTLGIPLLRGRHFTDRDDQTSQGVVIVSESFARRFLPNEDAIGTRIKLGGPDSTRPWMTIVGIAGDVRDTTLEKDSRACVYVPYPQFPSSSMTLVVQADIDPKPLVSAMRDVVWAIDKDQPLTDVKTMNQYVSDSVSSRRLNALLFGVFASLALALTSVGVYGVMAYSVNQRIHEIGIRVALGAQRSDVIKLVVGRGMALVFAGLMIGLAGALALTRLMSSLLYGVSASDPITLAAVSLTIVIVSLMANYIPARRATKVDPMIALKHE